MRFSRRARRAMIVLLAASVVPSLALLQGSSTASVETEKTSTSVATPSTSVVWLVLDEAPLYALLTTAGEINEQRFPGFAMLAKSSTWFRDALTTAQRTTEAVPALLTGSWPIMRDYPFFEDHPVNLFTLTKDKYALDVYQSITSLCPRNLCANRISGEQRQAEFQVRAFRQLITNASASREPTIHFSHIQLPHRPWRFSNDFRLGREMPTDPRPSTQLDRRRDSYQALLRQYVATDSLLLELLTTLKASPNWDKTMLIVTADHGMTFVPGESFRDTINPDNPGTLEDIYRIPLFIKYPQQNSASINNCPVSAIDILPTVLSVADVDIPPTVDGFNLTEGCPQRTSRRIQWPYSGRDLSTTFEDVLNRVQYYNTWISANGSVDDIHRVGRSGVLIGTKAPTSIDFDVSVTWTNVDQESFKDIGDSPLAYVPSRVSGRVVTQQNLCDRCEGILVVDGVIVASIPELAGLQASAKSSYFTTSLLTTTITNTSSAPDLWIADWTTTPVVLRRVGPSR